MFDMLSKTGFSSEFRSSIPSCYSNSNLMMDSRNFQESRGALMGKSSDEADGALFKMCTSDVEDDDGLELSLAPPVGGSSMVKRSSKLRKEPSVNFGRSTEPPIPLRRVPSKGEVAAPEQGRSVDLLALQSLSCNRKDQKVCDALASRTHDQVWEALQKENLLSSHDAVQVEGAAAFQVKPASTSLWGGRSNSMQLVVSMKEGSEGAPQPMRRVSSNGASVNMNMMPQLCDGPPASLSRQVSSVESLLEKGSDSATTCPQRQEVLERQRKIEQQALRRQEARRRRKCLIVEKQHKKARKDDRSLPMESRSFAPTSPQKISSLCVDECSFPLGQVSDFHHRLTNKDPSQSALGKPGVCVSRIGDDNENGGRSDRLADVRQKPLDFGVTMEFSVERKPRGLFVEEHGVETEAMPGSDSCVDLQSFYSGGLEQESITRGERSSVSRRSSSQKAVPAPLRSVHRAAVQVQEQNMSVGINEAAGKICHSSTSETESADTNEELSTVQNDCGEIDASNSKYEGSQCVGSGLAFPSVNSLSYPRPFPVVPIPYPIAVPGAPPAAIPLQLGFSLPCFMQYSTAGGGESSIPSSSQLPTSYSVPGSTLSPYRYPVPDGSYPWFPVVPAGGASAAPQSSKVAPASRSQSNECKVEQLQGKCLEDAEKSAVSDCPVVSIQRTNSKSHSKDQLGTLLPPSPKRLECQASAPAAQRKLTGGPSSTQHERRKDGPVNWNLSLERQNSLPVATRIAPQDAGSVEQSALRSHTAVDSSHVAGGEAVSDTESRPKIVGNCGYVNFSSALKHEEGSAESQLASETSGQEVSIEQPLMLDGQKSGSIPELPWVSTTGVGPNGKTISGVMYISDRRQIRLVCSCHGKHMSPAEFVEHSGSIDLSNPERNILVNPFPFLGQVATTPV